MNFEYDVVVIGAGPAGSTVAYYLAENNLKVALVEKKTQIGYPLQCAGILSYHIHDFNDLPQDLILNEVKGAFIHSKNNILKVEKKETVAYVIDRIAYDNFLVNRAIDSGVELIHGKAVSFDTVQGITYLENDEKITSKVIVGCDGYNSKLSLEFGNEHKSFNATQFLVKIDDIEQYRKSDDDINSYVDTFICQDVLPGFIWLIPLKDNLYRVGLFSDESHKWQKEYIQGFLDEHFFYEIKEKYNGFIPVFNQNNSLVKNRALLIGDAASQVKPTSGGGLLLAFDACKIASRHIIRSVEDDSTDLLMGYEKEFMDKYLKEMNSQFKVQKSFNLLTDDDFEYLFLKLKENNCEEIISQYGDMDKQSVLVKEFFKRGLVFKIIPSFIFKKVSKIFGFR